MACGCEYCGGHSSLGAEWFGGIPVASGRPPSRFEQCNSHGVVWNHVCSGRWPLASRDCSGGAGSPRLLVLQMGEIDLRVETDERAESARYVLSLRAGLDLTIENGVIQTAAGDDLDVRVEYLDEGG